MLKSLKFAVVAFATVGMIVPQGALANGNVVAPKKSVTPDVKLTNGVLTGRVITGEGQPVATTVKVTQGEKQIATVTSNEQGIYRVADLKTGQYTVSTDKGAATVRIWEQAAPPAAGDNLVIAEGPVVRGQFLGGLGGTPILVTLGVAAIVAGTVVAIVEANDDDDPSSP